MTDWGLPLSQYSQQCQACFAPQSGSGLDIVENTEQGRQANQYRYPRPERRYSVFRNQGTVAPEYSPSIIRPASSHPPHLHRVRNLLLVDLNRVILILSRIDHAVLLLDLHRLKQPVLRAVPSSLLCLNTISSRTAIFPLAAE